MKNKFSSKVNMHGGERAVPAGRDGERGGADGAELGDRPRDRGGEETDGAQEEAHHVLHREPAQLVVVTGALPLPDRGRCAWSSRSAMRARACTGARGPAEACTLGEQL